ncbi:RICIN domain-containing protein [Crossiella sp. SN42]|uniref:RICIN domain-containing protein n=1 Tax=Crossiella sp. SN42 TaxID=2944808 RepID=UPI00207CF4E3|nr:RICIN domain-containing protein [Crossiella sp. SN42]MCO1575667.1 RICIN domain-containing protein [Crossiella sp. SN42]
MRVTSRIACSIAAVVTVFLAVALPASAAAPITTHLKFLHSQKCLETANNTGHNGARVQQWNCAAQPAAYWIFNLHHHNGTVPVYWIQHKEHPAQCLKIAGPSSANGARAELYTCAGQREAYWELRLKEDDPRYAYLRNELTGKCLQIAGASQANGAVAEQWDCQGQQNAYWNRD